MDYEQKYNEALERAKNYCDGHHTDVNPQKAMEYIFPELKESEDDRIRHSLMSFLNSLSETEVPSKEMFKKWWNWLEKQGDQKAC